MEAKSTSTAERSKAPREQDDTEPAEGSRDTLDDPAFNYTLSAMDRQYATQTSVPRRIHILGTGSIGKLVAHSLRGIANPPPITLLLHRRNLLQAWERSTKEITISDDGIEVKRSGYEAELMPIGRRQHGIEIKEDEADLYDHDGVKPHELAEIYAQQGTSHPMSSDVLSYDGNHAEPKDGEAEEDDTIHNLIVTTKASFTVGALSKIRHRLTPASTICFLQNGMGVIDEINEKLYPDEKDRPNYMQGIITHGVNVPPEIPEEKRAFYAVHAGHGTLSLSLIKSSQAKSTPRDLIRAPEDVHDTQSELWASSSRYLIRTLTRTPVLCAVGFTPTELLQLQLEKLAVNSVLNPLTVLLDNRNGSILYNFAITRTMRLLLAETSLVIRSLPELQNIPNVNTRFSAQRLETLVVSVANNTRDNISSMLADVRAGRQTEVEYINGYIVKRGEEMGIKCVVNYSTMQMVMGKSTMTQREIRGEVPSEVRETNP
ncbi:hypothetical protein MBLNU13_g08390t1 [Cladosporium sp. NU13]